VKISFYIVRCPFPGIAGIKNLSVFVQFNNVDNSADLFP
jgi:hypothetical protein